MGGQEQPQIPRIVGVSSSSVPQQYGQYPTPQTAPRPAVNEQGVEIWVRDTSPVIPITNVQEVTTPWPGTPAPRQEIAQPQQPRQEVTIPELRADQVNRIDKKPEPQERSDPKTSKEKPSLVKKRLITTGVLGVLATATWFGAEPAAVKLADVSVCKISQLPAVGFLSGIVLNTKQACGEDASQGGGK
jgi:hypothetical protein